MDRLDKALVTKRDPLATRGGKVPLGELPPGARPASGCRAIVVERDHTPELDVLVGAGTGFYDWEGVRSLLKLDEAGLQAAVVTNAVLCLRDGEGYPVFPVWQFTRGHHVLPFLPDIVRALSHGIDDPWTWALWLTSPCGDDEEASAVDLLTAGADPRPILAEAQRDAARWRS